MRRGSLAVTESARYEMVIDSPAGDVSVFWIGKRNLLGQMGQKKKLVKCYKLQNSLPSYE